MGWITHGYWCAACEHETIAMFDRRWPHPAQYPCEQCEQPAVYKPGAAFALVSHPDGTTKRFQSLRETRKLQKERRKAFYKRDKAEKARLDNEIKKVR